MVNKTNILKDIGLVNGTNSMTPKQIEELGTILPDKDSISILEFGAGKSTILIYNALKTYYKNVTYITYETNQQYVPNIDGIVTRMHTIGDLINSNIVIPIDELYDIVIVDGPDGELRKYWYPIFANNVSNGTIVHIDDAFHYPSFEAEFKKYFPKTTYIFENGRNENKNKCWITAKIENI